MNQSEPIKGFLLTRQWRDTPKGIELEFWVQTDDGPARIIIENQQAVCFVRRDSLPNISTTVSRKPVQLKTLQHESVDALYFNQQRDLNQWREHLAHDKTILLESEIKPTDRYLMERFVTASLAIYGQRRRQHGYWEFINPILKSADYQPTLKWLSLDIETENLDGCLFSIAVTGSDQEKVFVLTSKAGQKESDLPIHWCATERELIEQAFAWINRYDPDVLVGWNVIAFDLDYLANKCRKLRIPFALGRGKSNATLLRPQGAGQMYLARIPGRFVLDGITSLRGAFWSFESFALDHVASELLGKQKLVSVEGTQKVAEIIRLFEEDPIELAEYNLEDCRLVAAIFEKTDLFNFSIQRAKMTGLAIDRQGGSTAAFDNLYLPRLHRKGFVAPDIGSQQNQQHSPGGFVMNSQPGLYDNVLVLDFKSLYPSIIRTFKIDPLGLALGDVDGIPGFLDAFFSRKTYILPDIVTALWAQRDLAKKHHDKPLSQAVKIIMNSFYGVLGSNGCRFFNPQLASSITRRGHEIIQKSRDLIEGLGYSVIYGDTDSVFVLLGSDRNEAQCLQIGKTLESHLNTWWSAYIRDTFQLESHLEIEFETHYLRFLMPTIRGAETGSKKRYAGMIDAKKQSMVFKGLETVRTDWTPLAREFQKALYTRIFRNQPYKDFVQETYDKLLSGELDNKLVYTKRLRRPLETYTSTQPPQVKAARKMQNPGRRIHYVMTLNGPEPIENLSSRPNYQHYLDKQLAPAADGILQFMETSFERLTARQLDVFG